MFVLFTIIHYKSIQLLKNCNEINYYYCNYFIQKHNLIGSKWGLNPGPFDLCHLSYHALVVSNGYSILDGLGLGMWMSWAWSSDSHTVMTTCSILGIFILAIMNFQFRSFPKYGRTYFFQFCKYNSHCCFREYVQ